MKKARQLIIGLAIAVGALYYTLRNISLDELIASFKEVELVYVLPAFVIILLTFVIRAYRWQILLRPFKDIPVSDIYAPLMIGFMGNILPARAGEFLRAYLVGKKQGITFAGAFSTIIVERLFDLIFLLILFVWVFVVNVEMFDPQLTFSGVSVQTMLTGFGKLCGVLVIGLLSFMFLLAYKEEQVKSFIGWLVTPLPDNWKEKITLMVGEFALGCKIIKDPGALLRIVLLSAVLWLFFVATYYPFYYAFDLQNKSLDSVLLLTVMVCVLITVLPTPGFLGSFNAGVLIALHEIMGEAEVTAVSFGMVSWAASFIVLIAGGVFYIFKDHMSMQSLIKAEEEAEAELEQIETTNK
ncbi:MAG: flippase-like domain-containing protein [Nitrospina sp.]|nr:flippase-like domain-containing protein [Nitrospina sp.]MBT3874668.1 flippase-like domain-containing protein [Nitrospina sp.]MBT4049402.1 flippase-like domain-containing protein [Nitrospina sp.]MBT4556303.1 flippase-like domain-containing protein [Nitrospina sp.]MBT5347128.1 flippase-like domain-containing protein [Nitrospina sp.]